MEIGNEKIQFGNWGVLLSFEDTFFSLWYKSFFIFIVTFFISAIDNSFISRSLTFKTYGIKGLFIKEGWFSSDIWIIKCIFPLSKENHSSLFTPYDCSETLNFNLPMTSHFETLS